MAAAAVAIRVHGVRPGTGQVHLHPAVRVEHRLAVGVPDHVHRPEATERVAFAVALRIGERAELELVDRAAERHQLVVVRRGRERQVPADLGIADRTRRQEQLEAPVGDLADVDEMRAVETRRRGVRNFHEGVHGALVVVREFDSQRAAEQRRIEPGLVLAPALGFEVGVSIRLGRQRVDGCVAGGAGGWREGPVRREGRGRVPGLAPREPQLELVHVRHMEKGLVGQDVRQRELGILDGVELRAEGRVVVDAERRGGVQPLAPGELFLEVHAERRLLDQLLVDLELCERPRLQRGEVVGHHPAAEPGIAVELARVDLHARRRA